MPALPEAGASAVWVRIETADSRRIEGVALHVWKEGTSIIYAPPDVLAHHILQGPDHFALILNGVGARDAGLAFAIVPQGRVPFRITGSAGGDSRPRRLPSSSPRARRFRASRSCQPTRRRSTPPRGG